MLCLFASESNLIAVFSRVVEGTYKSLFKFIFGVRRMEIARWRFLIYMFCLIGKEILKNNLLGMNLEFFEIAI